MSLVSANPCTDPGVTGQEFIDGGCCLESSGCYIMKNLTSGVCAHMDTNGACFGMDQNDAYTTKPCSCNNCGPGETDPAYCSGGAIEFTALILEDETPPVSDPCGALHPTFCEQYSGCKLNSAGDFCDDI